MPGHVTSVPMLFVVVVVTLFYLLLEVLSTQKGQETKLICDRLSNCSVWFFALSYCHPFQRGRRKVTGHGEWRDERGGKYGSGDRWERERQASGREYDRPVQKAGLEKRKLTPSPTHFEMFQMPRNICTNCI